MIFATGQSVESSYTEIVFVNTEDWRSSDEILEKRHDVSSAGQLAIKKKDNKLYRKES